MKFRQQIIFGLVSLVGLMGCKFFASMPTRHIEPTPAIHLTPATMEVAIGEPVPTITYAQDWPDYKNKELGLSLSYPPGWKAIESSEVPGVGLYPPDSDPNFPSPMIQIEWLDVPYSTNQPLVKTESTINTIEIDGIRGRQYQDSQFANPTQSNYIELPYRDRVLFIATTLGPAMDLTGQLTEILKTIKFVAK